MTPHAPQFPLSVSTEAQNGPVGPAHSSWPVVQVGGWYWHTPALHA